MRIECEVCNATYTIDDGQLSDQPIGAQCPYCGHVKLVKKGDGVGAAASGPPPPPPPTAPGFLGASDPFAGGGGQPQQPQQPSPFGGGGGGGAGGAGGGSPFGAGSPFGGQEQTLQSSSPPPPPPPMGGGLAADLAVPNDATPNMPGAPPGMQTSGGMAIEEDAAAKCQVCGTALTDEFDKVIGLCEEHQRDRRTGDFEGGQATPAVASWHVRTQGGKTEGPMQLEELRTRIRGGELSPTDEFSNDGIAFAPIGKFKEIAYLASLAVGGEAAVAPRSTYAKPRPSLDISRFVTPVLFLLVLAGLGFLGWTQRSLLERVYQGIVSPAAVSGPIGPNPLKRYVANWRLAHPDVSGTASEHLVTARARHLEDTWRGYQQAEKAYERALLLDEQDVRGIAGYVENFAVWRFSMAPPDERRVAEAAAKYAAALEPDLPDAHRALAALSLAKGDLHGCRAGADKAIEKNGTDARARLLLAGCFLEGNVQLAIGEATRAQQLMPELRAVDRFVSMAYTRTGRYASAIDTLKKRLEVDPDNAAVHLSLGQVYQEVSDTQNAEQHFKRASVLEGDRQAAYLALAELKLEASDEAAAIRYFDSAATERPLYGQRAARVYGGWARAELLRRRASRAQRLADQALSHTARDPVALLVRGEASLLAGSATTAHAYARRALDARPGEPAALVLQARAFMEQGLKEQALKVMETAIQNDPRDPRLKGILASFFLSMGASPQAYALMRRAADVDPEEAWSRARRGPLGLTSGPVRDAIEQFRRSATEERNASVASSSMAMMHYFLGNRPQAAAAVDRALRIDQSNVTALLYEAQLGLDRSDPRRAAKSAQTMLAIERGTAIGSLMLARALVRQNKIDKAREQFRYALRSNPGLLAAKVELAALDLEDGDRDAALLQLQTAFRVNPNSMTLRKTLLQAGI